MGANRDIRTEAVINAVRKWVDAFVIELNLCPFAYRALEQDRAHFTMTSARNEEELLSALRQELQRLVHAPRLETSVLIHPYVLLDFFDYNQFLDAADALLRELALTGTFQIASFHPHYQFAGTTADDAENYSNRSPYPLLHILREDSVAKAVDGHPDVQSIPIRNIALLRSMGTPNLQAILANCTGSEN